jgi:hypothetical protein
MKELNLVDINGNYFCIPYAGEAPSIPNGVTLVPERPSVFHEWNGESWVTTESSLQEKYRIEVKNIVDAVSGHLNVIAQQRRYTDGVSLATYANSRNSIWAAEAEAFIDWRDEVWEYTYSEMDKALNGTRELPSEPMDFISELPFIEWPR